MMYGLKGVLSCYTWSSDGVKYSFDIHLTDQVSINGKGYETPEERDSASREVAKMLGIILTSLED